MFFSNQIINRQVLCLSILVFLTLSCTRYYKPVVADTSSPEATSKVLTGNTANKYFILRRGSKSYSLTTISVDNNAQTLNAMVVPVLPLHKKYITARGRKYGYKNPNVLNEIHIFSKDTGALDIQKPLILPFDRIEKIVNIEHDKARTTTSYIMSGVGITLGVAAVVVALAAASVSSTGIGGGGGGCNCPYISTYDGQEYAIQGELYSGAINQKLERPDYLPVKAVPFNGQYQLRISNELKEKQYTDYADLIVIEHGSNTQVGFGTDGKAYTLSSPVAPSTAVLNDNLDVLKYILYADQVVCSFNDTLGHSSANEIILNFPNQDINQDAKLVLNLRNNYWLEYVFSLYTRGYGNRFSKWQEKVNKEPAEKTIKWINDQDIPLSVLVSTTSGWKEIVKLNSIGSLINRQIVIPIPGDTKKGEPIRIKLKSGFMFWELDYAAMDFTVQEPVTTTILSPFYAVDENGKDVLYQIAKKDKQYLTQPKTGNFTILKYRMDKPITAGKAYSAVLATSGYYELIKEYSGKPDITFLKKFKEPGALSKFSMEKYQSIIKIQSAVTLNIN